MRRSSGTLPLQLKRLAMELVGLGVWPKFHRFHTLVKLQNNKGQLRSSKKNLSPERSISAFESFSAKHINEKQSISEWIIRQNGESGEKY